MRNNPLTPWTFIRPRLQITPTNTRWVSHIWKLVERREGWAIDTPWFTIVMVRKS